MRALVTGADGFVGRHLVAHLRALGDEVIETDLATGGPDLLDGERLQALLARTQPEVVYHLAGQADVARSWRRPRDTFRVNAEGLLNLLISAAEIGVSRVLAVTSADIYGHVDASELPLTEAAPFRPVSPYAASKAAAEMVAVQGQQGLGLPVIRARAFNHLGPGQSDRFVAAALAARIVDNERSGRKEVTVGNLTARRDFTDVRDVVRAYRMLMDRGTDGEAYNVCSGIDVAISEVADALIARAAHPMQLVSNPALERPVELSVLRGDYGKLRAATGWSPEFSLERTLDDTLAAWRAQRNG